MLSPDGEKETLQLDQKFARLAEAVLPGAGSVEAHRLGREAGKHVSDGDYGRAATAVGVGTLQAGLDFVPGAAAARLLSRPLPPFRFIDPGKTMVNGSSLHGSPQRPPRPFEADYPAERWPDGVPADPQGGLLQDIEKRPLRAAHVAGRRTVGGEDVHAGLRELDDILGRLEVRVDIVPPQHKRLGNTRHAYYDPDKNRIYVNSDLSELERYRAKAHEFGHVVMRLAGRIPMTSQMKRELEPLYSAMATGRESARRAEWTLPWHFGYYFPRQRNEELIAEGIRAYLENPNALKALAPEAAKAIRAAVNGNRNLAPVVQFNSLAGIGAGGAAASLLPPPEARPPIFFGEDEF